MYRNEPAKQFISEIFDFQMYDTVCLFLPFDGVYMQFYLYSVKKISYLKEYTGMHVNSFYLSIIILICQIGITLIKCVGKEMLLSTATGHNI